jgi:exonuclease SbcC
MLDLDDVHIMNMVDMLRELTLNGAQVFITTASNEIARYLERKFAFMQDEMVYYKLKREVNGGTVGKTTITPRTIPYLIAAGE